MKQKCVFIVLVLLLKVDCLIYSVVTETPCPGIFSYQSDDSGVFGSITIKSSGGHVNSVHTRANFTVSARLTTSFIGQIEVIGNEQLLQKFNRGEPLRYRVHFPVTTPLPKLTSIVVNGNTLCTGPGDVPGQHPYVTTLSLIHTIFLTRGPQNPQIFNPYESPESELEFVDYHENKTRIFTTNDFGNKNSTWSSDPSQVHNSTRPVTRPTDNDTVYEKPTRPRPDQTQPEHTPAQPEYTDTLKQQNPDYNTYYSEPTTQNRPAPPPPPAPTPEIISSPPKSPAATSVECGVIAGGNEIVPLIFNGNSYPRGDWPWLVAIYKRREGSLAFICSGTLVSNRHVVTAAHCMHQKSKISKINDMVVKVGVYNLEDWGDVITETRTLQSAQIHQSYNSTTLENDILVFTMERTVQFNKNIRPACLWNGNTHLSRIVGGSGVVAGWGQSEVGQAGKGEPRMVRIPVVSTTDCKASKRDFHKLTSSNTLCAGGRNSAGPCLGDSGGGLYILDNGRWRLRGVVSLSLKPSNGETTCDLNEYIIFTDTAQYLPWIKTILTQNLFDF